MKDKHTGLTYEDFQLLATNATCSENEKIGFPDSYRGGAEQSILDDVLAKLPALKQPRATIIDVGCGCGPLAKLLMAHCSAPDNDDRPCVKNGEKL
jgi:2-polyprenyl-3-methyl-5-hydroxy-6-metoxy-1,4-benzoquinol methylase